MRLTIKGGLQSMAANNRVNTVNIHMETWREVRNIFKKCWSKGRYEGWAWSKKYGTEGFKNV